MEPGHKKRATWMELKANNVEAVACLPFHFSKLPDWGEETRNFRSRLSSMRRKPYSKQSVIDSFYHVTQPTSNGVIKADCAPQEAIVLLLLPHRLHFHSS
jgi:hypothetical protein